MAFAPGSTPLSLSGSTVSLFLDLPLNSPQNYEGGFFVEGATAPPSGLLNGVQFNLYAASSTGTVAFDGQTYNRLQAGQYDLTQSWAYEPASSGAPNYGEIVDFEITPVPEPSISSALAAGVGLLLITRLTPRLSHRRPRGR